MSTILKALRQLERETPDAASEPVDPFGAVVEPDPTATPARKSKPKNRGRAGIGIGIGLASAGLLLIGLALQPIFRTSTPSVAVAASAPATEAVVAKAAPARSEPSSPVMPRASVAILSKPEAAAPNEEGEGAPELAGVPMAAVVAVSDEPVQQLVERFKAANAPRTPEDVVPVGTKESAPVAQVASAAPREAKPGPGARGDAAVAFVPAVAAAEIAGADESDQVAKAPVAAQTPKPVVVVATAPTPAAVRMPPKSAPKAVPTPEPEAAAKPAAAIVKSKPDPPVVAEPAPASAPPVQFADGVRPAEVALDSAVPDFEEIRRPLDPPVMYPVRTSWHPKADRREARLEAVSGQAQVVREGDEVDGYTVLEISPSAVVFERGGETVRVRVGGR
jgi:hypothetical protein